MSGTANLEAVAPLTDAEFVLALEECRLPIEMFRHRDHLRLAWLYLREAPFDQALARMEQSIRRFAAHHGAPRKYRHTLTCLWMRLVALARENGTDADSFDDFIAAHGDLTDTTTPLRYGDDERPGERFAVA